MNQKRIVNRYAKNHTGIKEIRVVSGGAMMVPVFIFVFTAQDHNITSVLKQILATTRYFTTEDVCRWCVTHCVEYRVHALLIDWLLPWRYFHYRRILRQYGL